MQLHRLQAVGSKIGRQLKNGTVGGLVPGNVCRTAGRIIATTQSPRRAFLHTGKAILPIADIVAGLIADTIPLIVLWNDVPIISLSSGRSTEGVVYTACGIEFFENQIVLIKLSP